MTKAGEVTHIMVVIGNTVPARRYDFGGDTLPITGRPMIPQPFGFVRLLMTGRWPCDARGGDVAADQAKWPTGHASRRFAPGHRN